MLDLDIDTDGLAAQHGPFVDHFAVTAHRDFCALAGHALIVQSVGDGLGLADNAETRRGGNRNAPVAFVFSPRDQRMHRGLKSERRRVRRNVVHPPVGDQEGAGDALDGNVRQRRGQRAEQFGAVGFAIGLPCLDHSHFQASDLFEAVDQRFLGFRGLAAAVAEILARALVDHDGCDRRQRLAVFAREGRIGERQHDQRERRHADHRAARPPEQQQCGDHDDRDQREPKHEGRNERRKCDAILHDRAPRS
jgi:hypothetical protein